MEMTDKNGKLPTDEELALQLEVTVVRIQVRMYVSYDTVYACAPPCILSFLQTKTILY